MSSLKFTLIGGITMKVKCKIINNIKTLEIIMSDTGLGINQ